MAGGRDCRTTRVKDSLLWRKPLAISTLFSFPLKKSKGDGCLRGIFSLLADRFYIPALPGPGEELQLPQEVGRHLRTVLRLRPGDCLRLFDGNGTEAQAKILGVQRHAVRVRILELGPGGLVPWREIELAFAIPKGSRLETLLGQATQLGVRSLQPLHFARSPKSARHSDIPARWKRILQATAGQCGIDRIPRITPPLPFATWLEGPLHPHPYIALPPQRGTALLGLRPSREPASLLVGPEGGFSPEEIREALKRGMSPLTLAPTVLRVETACTAGLSLLMAAGRPE